MNPQYQDPPLFQSVLAKQSLNAYREMRLTDEGWQWRSYEKWLDNGSAPFWWVDMPVEFSEDTDHPNVKRNANGSYTSYDDSGERVGTHGTYEIALDVWQRRMALRGVK